MTHNAPLRLDSGRLAAITPAMKRFVDQEQISGFALGISLNGETQLTDTAGLMDREAGTPMTLDTIFQIASMTKPVTAAAAMTLYERGHFNLNTPVYEFLPEFRDLKVANGKGPNGIELEDLVRPITMRHLFTHTAGLSYGGEPGDLVDDEYRKAIDASKEEATSEGVCRMLGQMPLAFQPGTQWRYSLAIDVIGRIVELISGSSLDVYLKEHVCDPLGMTDTGYWVREDQLHRLARIYGHPDDTTELQLLDDIKPESLTKRPVWTPGGHGLVSTLPDYLKFTQMMACGGELDGTRILSPTTVDMFAINQAPGQALPYGFAKGEDLFHWGYGYSLGTRVLTNISKSGQAGSVGEFGWDGAYNTCFWVDPILRFTGVFMTQHFPNNYSPIADTYKQVAYAALV